MWVGLGVHVVDVVVVMLVVMVMVECSVADVVMRDDEGNVGMSDNTTQQNSNKVCLCADVVVVVVVGMAVLVCSRGYCFCYK